MKRAALLCIIFFVLMFGIAAAPLPGDEQAPASVTLLVSRGGVRSGGAFDVAVIIDVRPRYHVIREGKGLTGLSVAFSSSGPLTFSSTVYPGGETTRFDFLDGPIEIYSGRKIVRAEVRVDPDARPGPVDISAKVRYQACAENLCFPTVEETLTLRLPVLTEGAVVEEINTEVFGVALRDDGGAGGGISYLGLLAYAFLWGIGACLTPCIYPMIAITVGFFGGQVSGRPKKILLLAIVYVIGLAITYSALGVAAALSGRILGSALQSPVVIIAFSFLLAGLSLSMFGLYELRAPYFVSRVAGGKAGFLGAFIMGLLVAVVALPCLGPLTIGLMIYIQKLASATAGFLIFLAFSLGLGLPFIFLALFSGSLERLPKSGKWLLWVRKIFGFVLLGLAVYYLGPLLPEMIEKYLFVLLGLAAAVTLLLSGWGAGSGRVFLLVRCCASAAAIAFALYILVPSGTVEGPEWIPYSKAAVGEAVMKGRPGVIVFTAEWCPPCQEMKKKTFSSDEVIEALADAAVFEADLTGKPSPEVDAAVQKYGVKGVPTIIFIDSSGKERRDMRTVGFIGPAEFTSKMRSLTGTTR